MRNKRITQSAFTIKKVRRVLKTELGNFGTYDAWKVTGPTKILKYFVTRKHAQAYIKKVTDRTIN